MSQHNRAVLRIVVCAVGLFAAGAICTATEGAARNVAAKPAGTKHAATKNAKIAAINNAAAKRTAAKIAAGKVAAAKDAAAKRRAAKIAAAKVAAAKKAAAKNAPLAVSLARLAGSWKGEKSGLKVKIEQGSIGWEAWLSTDGRARITQPEADPKIIKIQSRTNTCTYTVTLPGAQRMKWESAPGQPNARCLGDSFTKLVLAPAKIGTIAPAKLAVEAKPLEQTGKKP